MVRARIIGKQTAMTNNIQRRSRLWRLTENWKQIMKVMTNSMIIFIPWAARGKRLRWESVVIIYCCCIYNSLSLIVVKPFLCCVLQWSSFVEPLFVLLECTLVDDTVFILCKPPLTLLSCLLVFLFISKQIILKEEMFSLIAMCWYSSMLSIYWEYILLGHVFYLFNRCILPFLPYWKLSQFKMISLTYRLN